MLWLLSLSSSASSHVYEKPLGSNIPASQKCWMKTEHTWVHPRPVTPERGWAAVIHTPGKSMGAAGQRGSIQPLSHFLWAICNKTQGRRQNRASLESCTILYRLSEIDFMSNFRDLFVLTKSRVSSRVISYKPQKAPIKSNTNQSWNYVTVEASRKAGSLPAWLLLPLLNHVAFQRQTSGEIANAWCLFLSIPLSIIFPGSLSIHFPHRSEHLHLTWSWGQKLWVEAIYEEGRRLRATHRLISVKNKASPDVTPFWSTP